MIDILDEHDALAEDDRVKCRLCRSELDSYDSCPFCEPDAEGEEVFEDFGDEADPSPMCNCGTCTPPDFTCIRKD